MLHTSSTGAKSRWKPKAGATPAARAAPRARPWSQSDVEPTAYAPGVRWTSRRHPVHQPALLVHADEEGDLVAVEGLEAVGEGRELFRALDVPPEEDESAHLIVLEEDGGVAAGLGPSKPAIRSCPTFSSVVMASSRA